MLSKKEILENGTPDYVPAIHCIKQYKEGNCSLDSVEICIKSAMDEYAKQEAIGFYIWAQANGWSRYHGIDRWKNSDQKQATKTSDELYPLYLKRIINAK